MGERSPEAKRGGPPKSKRGEEMGSVNPERRDGPSSATTAAEKLDAGKQWGKETKKGIKDTHTTRPFLNEGRGRYFRITYIMRKGETVLSTGGRWAKTNVREHDFGRRRRGTVREKWQIFCKGLWALQRVSRDTKSDRRGRGRARNYKMEGILRDNAIPRGGDELLQRIGGELPGVSGSSEKKNKGWGGSWAIGRRGNRKRGKKTAYVN